MNICYSCKENQDSQIPVLVCKCYCCNKCYNIFKQQKINKCECGKPLKRSARRNKIQNEIYKLNMHFST